MMQTHRVVPESCISNDLLPFPDQYLINNSSAFDLVIFDQWVAKVSGHYMPQQIYKVTTFGIFDFLLKQSDSSAQIFGI